MWNTTQKQNLSRKSRGTLTVKWAGSRDKIFSPSGRGRTFLLTSLLIELIDRQSGLVGGFERHGDVSPATGYPVPSYLVCGRTGAIMEPRSSGENLLLPPTHLQSNAGLCLYRLKERSNTSQWCPTYQVQFSPARRSYGDRLETKVQTSLVCLGPPRNYMLAMPEPHPIASILYR
jgi:hypothetical protein